MKKCGSFSSSPAENMRNTAYQQRANQTNLLHVPRKNDRGNTLDICYNSDIETSVSSYCDRNRPRPSSDSHGDSHSCENKMAFLDACYNNIGSFHGSDNFGEDWCSISLSCAGSAFEQAIVDDDKSTLKEMLEKMAKKQQKSERDRNATKLAESRVRNPLHTALLNNSPNALKLCLKFGLDPDLVDVDANAKISLLPALHTTSQLLDSNLPYIYTGQYLNCLPPIFLAVYSKKVSAVECLLRFGARVNCQDGIGCTPLHIACFLQNGEIVKLLIAHLAQVNVKNVFNQSPIDIWPEAKSIQTDFIEQQVYHALVRSKSILKRKVQSNKLGAGGSSIRRRISSRLKRGSDVRVTKKNHQKKLPTTQSGSDLKQENEDQLSNVSRKMVVDEDRVSENQETTSTRISFEGAATSCSQINSDTESIRDGRSSDYHSVMPHHTTRILHDDSKSLKNRTFVRKISKLFSIARAPECNTKLVQLLVQHKKEFIDMIKNNQSSNGATYIAELFMNIIRGCYENFVRNMDSKNYIERFYSQTRDLISLLTELTNSDNQLLQFTAFSCLNRLYDVYAHHNLFYPFEYKSWYSPESKRNDLLEEQNQMDSAETGLLFRQSLPFSNRTSVKSKKQTSFETPKNKTTLKNPFAILNQSLSPAFLLAVISDKLKALNGPIGQKLKCTPSTRSSSCAEHCIAVMAARLLAVLSHGQSFQKMLTLPSELQNLCELLIDSTDPHVLCFLLQALSCIALNPTSHKSISMADISKAICMLISKYKHYKKEEGDLNVDVTRFSGYIMFFSCRILVYIGHHNQQFIKGINIKNFEDYLMLAFDLEINSPSTLDDYCNDSEDYLMHNCMIGQQVISSIWQPIAAISVEKMVERLIKGLKVTVDKQNNRFYTPVDDCFKHLPYLSATVHPLILVRILRNFLSGIIFANVDDLRTGKVQRTQSIRIQKFDNKPPDRQNSPSPNAYAKYLRVRHWADYNLKCHGTDQGKRCASDDERNYATKDIDSRNRGPFSALFTRSKSISQPNVCTNFKSLFNRKSGIEKQIKNVLLLGTTNQFVRRWNSEIPVMECAGFSAKRSSNGSISSDYRKSPPLPPKNSSSKHLSTNEKSSTDISSLNDSNLRVAANRENLAVNEAIIEVEQNPLLIQILDFIRFWILKFEDDLRDVGIHEEFSQIVKILEKTNIRQHPVVSALRNTIINNVMYLKFSDLLEFMLCKIDEG